MLERKSRNGAGSKSPILIGRLKTDAPIGRVTGGDELQAERYPLDLRFAEQVGSPILDRTDSSPHIRASVRACLTSIFNYSGLARLMGKM